jgi:hypothetical protein
MSTFNEAYSSLSARRRYEVWFLRMALADGSGAWWFRYLLMNPGRNGCVGDLRGAPGQVWATWFPSGEKPQTFIQGFPLPSLDISARGSSPFHFIIGKNGIEENSCRGALSVDGHAISWDIRYHSRFRATLSNKGWIGFSRTPHSDAVFSGSITMDGRKFLGDPLAFGLQGHNCGYRHRSLWIWTHAWFQGIDGLPSTLEALAYDMPLGLVFRKAVLWHAGKQRIFRSLQDERVNREAMLWSFRCSGEAGLRLCAKISGTPVSTHRLPYMKTNCSGTFEVLNNSLSAAEILIEGPGAAPVRLETATGAVLEIAGDYGAC